MDKGGVAVAEIPASSSAAGAVGKKAKRFEIKKWNAVALWAWDIVVDNCAICRNHIMDLCIECQANQASATSEECTVAWGKEELVILNSWVQVGEASKMVRRLPKDRRSATNLGARKAHGATSGVSKGVQGPSALEMPRTL